MFIVMNCPAYGLQERIERPRRLRVVQLRRPPAPSAPALAARGRCAGGAGSAPSSSGARAAPDPGRPARPARSPRASARRGPPPGVGTDPPSPATSPAARAAAPAPSAGSTAPASSPSACSCRSGWSAQRLASISRSASAKVPVQQRARRPHRRQAPLVDRHPQLVRQPGVRRDVRVDGQDVAEFERNRRPLLPSEQFEIPIAGLLRQPQDLVGERRPLVQAVRPPDRHPAGVQRGAERRRHRRGGAPSRPPAG